MSDVMEGKCGLLIMYCIVFIALPSNMHSYIPYYFTKSVQPGRTRLKKSGKALLEETQIYRARPDIVGTWKQRVTKNGHMLAPRQARKKKTVYTTSHPLPRPHGGLGHPSVAETEKTRHRKKKKSQPTLPFLLFCAPWLEGVLVLRYQE